MSKHGPRCECGRTRVDGKCPTCDVALARPTRRAHALSKKLAERESDKALRRESAGTGKTLDQFREGFYRACDAMGKPKFFGPIRKKWRKRRGGK